MGYSAFYYVFVLTECYVICFDGLTDGLNNFYEYLIFCDRLYDDLFMVGSCLIFLKVYVRLFTDSVLSFLIYTNEFECFLLLLKLFLLFELLDLTSLKDYFRRGN